MGKRVTVRDVAEAAGVSATAVVLALNGRPGLGAETRERILGVANRLGYARSARGGKRAEESRSIHYILPRRLLEADRAEGPVADDLLTSAVERHCRANGRLMVVHYLGDQPGEMEAVISGIRSAEESPLALVQAADMEAQTALRWNQEIPGTVFLNRYFEEIQVDSVSGDNRSAFYGATQYLVQRGYAQIGRLRARVPAQSPEERQQGYLRCLEHNRLKSAGTWPAHTACEPAYHDVCAYLEQGVRFPRALLCDGDRQAMGAVRALREHGLRVPEDVAVMGFGDLPAAARHEPPLSTCAIPWDEMARLAVRRALGKAAGEEHPVQILVSAAVCRRGSA